MSGIDIQISLPFVYDFDRALQRLSRDPVNFIKLEERIVRVPMQEGNVITVQATGTKEAPSFIIKGVNSDQQVEEIKSIFHFNDSLADIQEHFLHTDLAPLFQAHEGTPFVRDFSLYGTLMKSVIHQQLNLSFAHTLTKRFVESFGEQIDGVWTYPSPERVSSLDVAIFREMQFSTRKAEYMIGLSQAIAEGRLDLDQFRRMNDDDVTSELIKYRGIGPWTAQSFLMFGLGRPNLFPLADVGLQNALQRVWGLDRKPTKDEMIERFPEWSPYMSYAALYLWRSLE